MFNNNYYIMNCLSWNPGFFSNFQSVVGFLNFVESNSISNFKVDFENGLYFDINYGTNWWEYYFEKINYGNIDNKKVIYITDSQKAEWCGDAISIISRERASYLINKYIKLKPILENKINNFFQKNFKNKYVIGVHYRGTDKSSEAKRVSYEDVCLEVEKYINNNDSVIFVATDENNFIKYMQDKFNNKVIFTNSKRSNNHLPVHHLNGKIINNNNNYKLGEDAVIDCYLLSRSSLIIRTHSNLSSSAANINCNLKVINLNHPIYSKKKLR